MRAIKTTVMSVLALGLLAGSAVGVAAQEDEDPVGPPGSEHVGLASWPVEPENEQDEYLTKQGPVFSYDADTLWTDDDGNTHPMMAFIFVRDEDWCRNVLSVQLEVEVPEDRLDDCMAWVEASPFGGSSTGIGRVVLPETWAVRIARRAGWHPDAAE